MCGEATLGYVDRDTLTQPTQQGWLIKVDEYGCLVPGCHIIDDVDEAAAPSPQWKLYPNPASDFLNVFFDPGERPAEGQFRVLDAQGRILKRFEPLPGETTYLLPLEGY